MSKIVVSMGVLVLTAGGAAFYVQHQANGALRRELTGLRDEVRSVAGAVRSSAEAAGRHQVSDAAASAAPSAKAMGSGRSGENEALAQLREEIVALRKSTQDLTRLAQAAQALKALGNNSDAVATKLIPANAWKNAGKGTPEATTETILWAAVGGEVDTLAQALTFTASAREKADTWFAGLSENTRQQYGSPEKVIALMIARDAAALTGMQVLGQKEVSVDDVGMRVRFASDQGKVKDESFLMHRSADGWRMVLPDSTVEKFARQLGGGK